MLRCELWIAGAALAAGAVFAVPAVADIAIEVDPGEKPWKDQRASRTAPNLGYAGSVADHCDYAAYEEFFVRRPDETWRTFREAGAHFVKEWGAVAAWQLGRAFLTLKTDEERKAFLKKNVGWARSCGDPKVIFDWRQRHGVKVLLCLEQWSVFTDAVKGERSSDIADVKRVILEYVKWIVDSGYRDQVAGFELGNEPFFACEGDSPEQYAARWAQIVPEIKRIFPEADIGIPVAEYRENNPDLAAVRARSTNVDSWFANSKEFGFRKLNQWSGRFIVAFSNSLDLCSHVIYHFYGGDAAYDMSPSGYNRLRNFAKVFPEIKDKRVWITEWRERSDENQLCHQTFSSSLVKAHYMLATICQPEIDGMCLHSCNVLSGGFAIATGAGNWWCQFDVNRLHPFVDPDWTGRPRLEVGPAGPVFKLFNEALIGHPLIYDHGQFSDGKIGDQHYWSGAIYYAYHHKAVKWLTDGADPKRKPKNNGNAEWVLVLNPGKTSAAILVVNSTDRTWRPTLNLKGFALGKPHYRTFRCKEEQVFLFQVPGEPKPTWEEEYDGDSAAIEVPGWTVATITFPIRKGGAR